METKPLAQPVAAPLSLSTLPTQRGRSLLTVNNPGRMSRNWLTSLGNSAGALGIRSYFIELETIRQAIKADALTTIQHINELMIQGKIGAVLSYAVNAAIDLPVDNEQNGAYRNFFEIRGIPQFFLWIDHPQWVNDKAALKPDVQALFRSGNQHHFLKSAAHAYELKRILGWANCYELPSGADTEVHKPAEGVKSEFDIVAVYGSDGLKLPEWILPFLEQDDPDPDEINGIVSKHAHDEIGAMWEKEGPENLRSELQAWTARAIELKLAAPTQALARHIPRLTDEFPHAMWWMTGNHPFYFRAAAILYKFRSWRRHFFLAYLSRYFRLALYGAKWSHVSTPEDQAITGHWVSFADLPVAIAKGKVAINVIGGWDEEGLTVKTFELAACGAAMIHDECIGLAEAFEPGKELEVFSTPKDARLAVEGLLNDDGRRRAMGAACRERVLLEHTWGHRLVRMFQLAGVPLEAFR